MRVQDACAQDVIEQMKGGGDVLVCAPTATGKSLMYMLPSLLDGGIGIVVSPLVALIKDQVATALSSCPPLSSTHRFPRARPKCPRCCWQVTIINKRSQELLGYDVFGAAGGASNDAHGVQRTCSGQYRWPSRLHAI